MAAIGLTPESQDIIREYLSKTTSSFELQEELDIFFDMLSPKMKAKVQNSMFFDILMRNPVLNKIYIK
jgi:hypothetical protein